MLPLAGSVVAAICGLSAPRRDWLRRVLIRDYGMPAPPLHKELAWLRSFLDKRKLWGEVAVLLGLDERGAPARSRRIFVSYEHGSRATVVALVGALTGAGLHPRWDGAFPRGPLKGWWSWIVREIDEADVILVVASAGYCDRFRRRCGGVGFEADLIANGLGPGGSLAGRIIVAVPGSEPIALPLVLAGLHRVSLVDGFGAIIEAVAG